MSDWIRAYMADPKEEDQHRTFLLQKYLLLHTQQESLRQQLSRDSSTSSATSPTSPRSPVFEATSSSPMEQTGRRGLSLESTATRSHENGDNDQLRIVNQQLKATLTELLNSDTVKHDSSFRMWVQSRLMDAEMELKRQRRRMSSVSTDAADTFRNGVQQSQTTSPI